MKQSLRDYWQLAANYQKFLYGVAAILLFSALFHTAVFLAGDSSWAGPVSWRKPITFGFSFGVTVLTLSWIMTFLPRRQRRGWLLAVMLGGGASIEVFLASLQQWRGVPSHFNESTPFDAAIWAIMGISIIFVMAVIVVFLFWSFIGLQAPPSFKWAIRGGLLLLVVSQGLGGIMAAAGGNTFGAAGLMKLPHAITLHAVQLLPLLAWLLRFTPWSEARRLTAVQIAAAGYTLLCAAAIWQTFNGLAPLALTAPLLLVVALGFALTAAPYLAALPALKNNKAQAVVQHG